MKKLFLIASLLLTLHCWGGEKKVDIGIVKAIMDNVQQKDAAREDSKSDRDRAEKICPGVLAAYEYIDTAYADLNAGHREQAKKHLIEAKDACKYTWSIMQIYHLPVASWPPVKKPEGALVVQINQLYAEIDPEHAAKKKP